MNRVLESILRSRWKAQLVLFFIAVVVAVSYFNLSSPQKSKLSSIAFQDFSQEISQENMMETVKALSLNEKGRIAGFDESQKTALYLETAFKSIGLETEIQEFPIQAYQNRSFKLSYKTSTETPLADVRVLSFSGTTPPSGISRELVMVGAGSVSDYTNVDVHGKFVLVQRGGELFRTKVARATDHGAAGVVFYDPNGESALSATLGQMAAIPAFCISRSEAEEILKLLGTGKKVTMNATVDSVFKDSTTSNVIGTLKADYNGSGKYIVVGAHYDGVDTPGANDNASGVAVMLEIARVMAMQDKSRNYDIKFVAFGAEEIGLIGSSAFVEQSFYDGKGKPVAMLNYDMVGVGDTIGIYAATGQIDTELVALASAASEQLKYSYEAGESDNSDHIPFVQSGISSVFFENGPYLDYHTDRDTIDAIDPDALLKNCNLGVALLSYLCDQEDLD